MLPPWAILPWAMLASIRSCCAPAPEGCVDPRAHALAAFASPGGTSAPDGLHEERLDLDADGVDDLLLATSEWCGSGGCTYFAYLSRGRCAVPVGALLGREMVVLPAVHHGLHDVYLETHGGYCPYTKYVAWFDGEIYRQLPTAWCDCDASPEGISCLPEGSAEATAWGLEAAPSR